MNQVSIKMPPKKVWTTIEKQTQQSSSQNQSAHVTRLNPWSLSTTSFEMLATKYDLRDLLSIFLSLEFYSTAAAMFDSMVEKCKWHYMLQTSKKTKNTARIGQNHLKPPSWSSSGMNLEGKKSGWYTEYPTKQPRPIQ